MDKYSLITIPYPLFCKDNNETASFSTDLTFEGMKCIVNMINEEKEAKRVQKYKKEDYEYLKGKVLIIEPVDDKTFTDDIKEALCNMMSEHMIGVVIVYHKV